MQAHPLPLHRLRERLLRYVLGCASSLGSDMKIHEDMTDTLSGDGTTRQLNLWYPRVEGNPSFVEVGLIDVRAADSIRISYDYERDGWQIEQASTFEWSADDKVCNPDWQ